MLQQIADTLSSWDRTLFYAINRGTENGAFDLVMPVVTSFGNFKYLLAGIAVFLFFNSAKTRSVAILIGIAILLSDQTGNQIKHLIERPRPCKELLDAHLLGGCSGSFAFPSNHSANMFSAALVLSWKYRRLTALFLFAAFLVAFSRVYVGVHYPFDVIGGAMLGLLCGAGALACEKWYLPRISHLLDRFTWKTAQ